MKKHISLLASLLCLGTTALANSPYISEVYDFMPAPGQFTNTIPDYENGDTQASMNASRSTPRLTQMCPVRMIYSLCVSDRF